MRRMTPSERIFSLLLLLALSSPPVFAADPPDAAMLAASQAISAAERSQPAGPAADLLAQARARYGAASDAVARRKYKDALKLADQSRALAVQAGARARLINARAEVEDKTNRNADLRRQLQMTPEARP
jgi:hypothetical protein